MADCGAGQGNSTFYNPAIALARKESGGLWNWALKAIDVIDVLSDLLRRPGKSHAPSLLLPCTQTLALTLRG
jgi:hypothetical protein